MFEFWREATAAFVPGLLCESGRRRPENFSILSSLINHAMEESTNPIDNLTRSKRFCAV